MDKDMAENLPFFKNMDKKCELVFDYEVNSIKLDETQELNCKMYYLDKNKNFSKIILK
jgi:hypothetical protein